MITTMFGFKLGQSRHFLEDGSQASVTTLLVEPAVVAEIVNNNKQQSYLLAFGTKKQIKKPVEGKMKKAGLEKKPRFLREVEVEALDEAIILGSEIKLSDVFVIGDKINVTGVSKGKGFAGVVKRHGFHGGSKTHGQGDRWRSPGSIGAGTTPGRVYRGLRMAGRMGNDTVTIKGLTVVEINAETNVLTIKGLVPGAKQGLIEITKA